MSRRPTDTQAVATPSLLVYGAGGFAREVAWLAETSVPARIVAAFIDDATTSPRLLNEIPVLGLRDAAMAHPNADFVAAVGSPATRERLVANAVAAGLRPATLVHHVVELSRWVDVGAGTVVCAGSILTTNVRLGQHVQINLDCTIGHDTVLEDYVTLAPGVHVSGWVTLKRGCYVGTGASIINGIAGNPLVVGAGATVGAGAVVTRSVDAGVTVVGIPARPRG